MPGRHARRTRRLLRKHIKLAKQRDASQDNKIGELQAAAAGLVSVSEPAPEVEVGNPTCPATFKTWCNTIPPTEVGVTCPKTDAEIIQILVDAASHNPSHKVRVMGTGHSAAGLVTNGRSEPENQEVISLAEYSPPADSLGNWESYKDTIVSENPRVTIPAGRTYLDLYQQIRPQCWFLPNQTAGFFL